MTTTADELTGENLLGTEKGLLDFVAFLGIPLES
jgi:hypothetical protein